MINKFLYNLNKNEIPVETQQKVVNEQIDKQLTKDVGCAKEFALIFNILEENIDVLKDTEHKQELVEYLAKRRQVKENVKKEF